MKKGKRIHHHAASKIRKLFSEKVRKPHAPQQEPDSQPSENATKQYTRDRSTRPLGQADQQNLDGEKAAHDSQREDENALQVPPRRNQIPRFRNWWWREKRNWRERWPILIAIGTLAAIIAQAVIYNEQRKIMNRQQEVMDAQLGKMDQQLNTMDKTLEETRRNANAAIKSTNLAEDAIQQSRESFRQGQRPYIWLTNNLGRPDCIRAANTPDPPSCYVVWDWRFTNYGQSPAYNVRATHSMIIGSNVLRKHRLFGVAKPAAPLPPNKEDFATAWSPNRVTPERFNELLNTEESILVFGRINYSDAQRGNYETGFCFYRLRTGAVAYCPTGNYVK
jgi:hypothetical protein